MRSSSNLNTILGSLCLAGTLALLSPGVHVVRADEPGQPSRVSVPADGPTCDASSVVDSQALVDALEHIQRDQVERLAASIRPDEIDPDFVAIDNRGYNQPTGE